MYETTNKTSDIVAEQNRQLILNAVRQWKSLLDNSPDLVAILDRKRQIILLNRTASVLLGVPQDKAEGKDYCALFHNGQGRYPDCPYSRLEKSGESQSGKESVSIHGRLFRISVAPITGCSGEIIAALHVAREICQ